VVVVAAGFVPCEDKHRVKEALWQRFVWSLTVRLDVCSASVCIKFQTSPLLAFWSRREDLP
jgi:hypothetical protein